MNMKFVEFLLVVLKIVHSQKFLENMCVLQLCQLAKRFVFLC